MSDSETDNDNTAASKRRRTALERAGIISGATMLSRVLGLLREHIFARLFGAGVLADAFFNAYRIPNTLRDLFAEGALTSALVPTLVDERKNHGDQEAFEVARVVFTALLLVVGLLTLLGIIYALERPGAPPSKPVVGRLEVDPAVGDPAVARDPDGDKLTAVGFVGLYVAVPGGWHNGVAFCPIRRSARWIGRAHFLIIFSNVNTRK